MADDEFVVIFDESEKRDNVKLKMSGDLGEYHIGVFMVMKKNQWLHCDDIFSSIENIMRDACNCHDDEIKSGIFKNDKFSHGLASFKS